MKNYKNRIVILGAIIFFGMGIWNNRLHKQIENLEYTLQNIQNEMSGIYNSNQALVSNIQNELEKNNSILASNQYKIQNYKPKKKEVDIAFSIVPRNQTNATKVKIAYQLNAGSEKSVELIKQNSSLYEGKITVPVTEGIQYRVLIENNGETEVEELQPIYELKESYVLGLNVEHQESSYSLNNNLFVFNGAIGLRIEEKPEKNELTSAHIEIIRNNQVIKTIKFKAGTKENYDQYASLKNIQIDALPKDIIGIVVKAKDSNGFTYSYVSDRWLIKENNDFDSLDIVEDLNRVIIE